MGTHYIKVYDGVVVIGSPTDGTAGPPPPDLSARCASVTTDWIGYPPGTVRLFPRLVEPLDLPSDPRHLAALASVVSPPKLEIPADNRRSRRAARAATRRADRKAERARLRTERIGRLA